MAIATITSKGQVTLPKEVRKLLRLETGEKIDFRVDQASRTAILVPLNKIVDDVFGVLGTKGKRKAVTVEEMDKAIKKKLQKEFT